ncbi:MAG: 3-keto-5-aminohexanoate cleavage protein [Thermoleophilia bacterium]|nr:3-keto-5-aminohexanoate cleavage protein [Thermoleophilia bacterium]
MPRPIITAALTGPVATKADNAGMPGNVAEIAADAKACHEAGAAVIHIHLRDDKGDMTANVDVARRTVEAVREVCPGITQLSTGGLQFTYEERMRLVEARPAMATLNPCSMTFAAAEFLNPPKQMMELAARMIELGVKPEVEIYDTGHLEMMLYLLHKELLVQPLQVSFVMGVRGGMKGDPGLLAYLVRELPEGTSWQVIGVTKANLPMTAVGLAMGGNARTGMEDTLTLEKGVPAESNRQLVERLVGIAQSMQLQPASVAEVVERLKLHPELVNGA